MKNPYGTQAFIPKNWYPAIFTASFLLAAFLTAFLLPITVKADTITLIPNSVGNYDQWITNTGTKINAVATNDGDATYISANSSYVESQTFSFPGAGIADGSTINFVTLYVVAKSPNNAIIKFLAEKGIDVIDRNTDGITNIGSNYPANYSRVMALNPFTVNTWTVSEVNNWDMNFGVQTTSDNKEAQITQMYLVVNYNPPDPILGCMDQNSINYNSNATKDDGSCVHPVENVSTSDSTISSQNPDALAESNQNCGLYMDKFIRFGEDNDTEQVKKLQTFLNKELGTNLPVTGVYESSTLQAVKTFQEKHAADILTPWNLSNPTGIVYQTTIREINSIECPGLSLAQPTLVAWLTHTSDTNGTSIIKDEIKSDPAPQSPATPSVDTKKEANNTSLLSSIIVAEKSSGGLLNYIKSLLFR